MGILQFCKTILKATNLKGLNYLVLNLQALNLNACKAIKDELQVGFVL